MFLYSPAIANVTKNIDSPRKADENKHIESQTNINPSQLLLSQTYPQINWGLLTSYFNISNIQFGVKEYTNSLGQISQFPALTFIVEAKRTFYTPIFFAEFYDAEGISVDAPSPLSFNPNSDFWNVGDRSRADVLLPLSPNMSKVAWIKFKQLG